MGANALCWYGHERHGSHLKPHALGPSLRRTSSPGGPAAALTLIRARYERVATAGLGNNETRKPPIVLQLRPETPYVAVHDAAFGHVVRPPQGDEDLLARDHSAGVGRQQVQQALLQRGQLLLRAASPHSAIQDVGLELAQPDHRRERERVAVRPAQKPDDPSKELLERERDRQDVVRAPLEC